MTEQPEGRFPEVGDGSGYGEQDRFHREELQLALRNRGMPLEGLRYNITPSGMHYLLVHFDIPCVDAGSWRLEVTGKVVRPVTLDLHDIQALPAVRDTVTMECAGNGRALLNPRPISQPWLVEAVSTAEWTGTPLSVVLREAGVGQQAVEVVFTGLDRGVQGDQIQDYQRSLSVEEALRDEVLLAYEMNGRPLEPQHGFPLRLLVPGWYGMTSVKWLTRIELVDEPFTGYQMIEAYRFSEASGEVGEPVNLIRPRALMIPPGVPDFLTRARVVQSGKVTLSGRAWTGRARISRVEVSTDGGANWADAEVGAPLSSSAWSAWTYEWTARPGSYELSVLATDSDGNRQPFEQEWTAQGVGNNMAQRVSVIVE